MDAAGEIGAHIGVDLAAAAAWPGRPGADLDPADRGTPGHRPVGRAQPDAGAEGEDVGEVKNPHAALPYRLLIVSRNTPSSRA
ncbi:hypothetical protein D9M69_670550 [compost metagenome]